MAKVIKFAEKNIVVLIAWLLAAVSMILVPLDPLYKGYFDLPTLVLPVLNNAGYRRLQEPTVLYNCG